MTRRWPILFLGALLVGLLTDAAAFAQAMGRAVLVDQVTETWVGDEPADPSRLQVNDPVAWGMTLKTGSRGSVAVVRLPPDKEVIFLGTNSRVTFNATWRQPLPHCVTRQEEIYSIRVSPSDAGGGSSNVRALVEDALSDCTLVLETAHVVVLVRRTDVRLAVTENATLVVVVEGVVEVWSRDGASGSRVGESVAVPAGESLLATAGGALLPGGVITEPPPSGTASPSGDPPFLAPGPPTPLPTPKPPAPLPGPL